MHAVRDPDMEVTIFLGLRERKNTKNRWVSSTSVQKTYLWIG